MTLKIEDIGDEDDDDYVTLHTRTLGIVRHTLTARRKGRDAEA